MQRRRKQLAQLDLNFFADDDDDDDDDEAEEGNGQEKVSPHVDFFFGSLYSFYACAFPF